MSLEQNFIKAVGLHSLYGASPSFDFLELLTKINHTITDNTTNTNNTNNDNGVTEVNNEGVFSIPSLPAASIPTPTPPSTEPINILLINPGDIRHILTTVSRRRRHSQYRNRPIHFYLLELPIETLARSILLLEVLNDYEVPIRQRANVYLEIFGNCKVQDRTCKYIEQLGHQLRSLVCDNTGRLEDIVDLSLLKYRDKDLLENVFKSYNRNNVFDIDKLRDTRLRAYYEDRYDSRKALADWDYHYSIKQYCSIIHIKQYKEWRLSGIAYEFGDQEYTEPNRTMMSYTEGVMKQGKDKGIKKEVKGYWGDIVCSPYISHGIDCDTPNKNSMGLFEIINKNSGTEQHRHHTVEIALYDMFCCLFEIETGCIYKMAKANDIYSGLSARDVAKVKTKVSTAADEKTQEDCPLLPLVEDVLVLADDDKSSSCSSSSSSSSSSEKSTIKSSMVEEVEELDELAKAIQRAECIVDSFDGIKVLPILTSSTSTIKDILNKQRYVDFFDSVFVSSKVAQCMSEDYFKDILKEKGVAVVETARYIVPLNSELKDAFINKLDEYGRKLAWRRLQKELIVRKTRDVGQTINDVIFFQKQ